jgi:hypothetical protein
MSAKDVTKEGGAGMARSKDRGGNPHLLGRKSVLMGMLTSGFVIANASQPSAVAAGTVKPSSISSTQPAYVPKWMPGTAYVRGQQVISPCNDVVSTDVAHTSSAAYATDTAKWTLSAAFVHKDAQVISVKDYGAVGDGRTDDSAAITSAYAAAVAAKKCLFFPGGTYLAGAPALVISGVDGFSLNMNGRLKRNDNSARSSMIVLSNSTNVSIGTIRTDGNAANNGYGGFLVDEVKQDVRLDNCTRVKIGLLDSINPAGDSLYIAGGTGNNTTNVQIDTVSSVSTTFTGRNAVSIIKGANIQIGKILSINTGHPGNGSTQLAMPSGLDIEPNISTDLVNNVQVGSLIVRSAGGGGLGVYSGAGQIITNVTIASISIEKNSSVSSQSAAANIMGVKHLSIGSFQHKGDGVAMGVNLDDSSDVRMDMHLNNCGGVGLMLGASATVTDFLITGSIRITALHSIVVYAADNGVLDMTIQNQGDGYSVIAKNSGGSTSSNLIFRGNWTIGTTGSLGVSADSATTGITNWLLDRVDLTGYPADQRIVSGTTLQNVAKRNCVGLNFGTAAPSWDIWRAGDIIWNTTPAAGGVPGWICVTSGSPGTWKAMGVLAT